MLSMSCNKLNFKRVLLRVLTIFRPHCVAVGTWCWTDISVLLGSKLNQFEWTFRECSNEYSIFFHPPMVSLSEVEAKMHHEYDKYSHFGFDDSRSSLNSLLCAWHHQTLHKCTHPDTLRTSETDKRWFGVFSVVLCIFLQERFKRGGLKHTTFPKVTLFFFFYMFYFILNSLLNECVWKIHFPRSAEGTVQLNKS